MLNLPTTLRIGSPGFGGSIRNLFLSEGVGKTRCHQHEASVHAETLTPPSDEESGEHISEVGK